MITKIIKNCPKIPETVWTIRDSPSSDDVLLEQLLGDVDDVGYVYLVDETVDGLLQGFP